MSDVLSVSLPVTAELVSTLQENEGMYGYMRECYPQPIDCAVVADEANDDLRRVKLRITALQELKAGFVKPAQQILANANALFDKPLKALAEAEKALKLRIGEWTQEQERIAAVAKAKAQEEERKRRQEAEALAAAERARAEEQAREQRRLAAEAEERRRKAEEEGNAKEAARAAAEAAKATAKADAVIENAETKSSELLVAAVAATPEVEAPRKVAGFSMRDNWKAEAREGLTDEQVLAQIVAACTVRTDLLSLLKIDWSSADKLAKAQKRAMSVPGMVAVNRPVASSRAA